MNAREIATILAALRSLQNVQEHEALAPEILDIATNGGEFEPMTAEEVDALCERLNTEGALYEAAPKMLETLKTIRDGSTDDGRWLDEAGNECDESENGARFVAFDEEEQGMWISSVAEMSSNAIAAAEGKSSKEEIR